MNSIQAFKVIEAVAAASSRTEKHDILAANASDPFFRRILKAAYDPFVTYGLKAPKAKAQGSESPIAHFDMDDYTWNILDDLAARKLTGNIAKADVASVLAQLEPGSAELLSRIINRDLRCGISNATINDVIPGLVKQFAVMRAEAYEAERVKSWPQAIEPKLDGFRVTCLIEKFEGSWRCGFFSRNGKPFETIDHLKRTVIDTFNEFLSESPKRAELWGEGAMLDGEAIIDGSFKETSSKMRRGGADTSGAAFHIFDMMPIGEFLRAGDVDTPFEDRRGWVERFVAKAIDPATIKKTTLYWVHSLGEIDAFYKAFRARQLEGAMVKDPKAPYRKKKGFQWMKIKPEETEDLVIVGVFNGEAGTKYANTLGGVIVDRQGVHVRVGGGFSDGERDTLWQLWCEDAVGLGLTAYENVGFKPGVTVELKGEPMHLIGRMIEVEFHEVTPDGSLRHPRFVRFRDDKQGELEAA